MGKGVKRFWQVHRQQTNNFVIIYRELFSLFVCLFIFSSIYLFYKPFILYYKIEELKMLFVELNIGLQE